MGEKSLYNEETNPKRFTVTKINVPIFYRTKPIKSDEDSESEEVIRLIKKLEK